MLDYARQRATEILRVPRRAVLATDGPAGLLASELPCEARETVLYLLVPRASDHLFNIEENQCVSVLANGWELTGEAEVVTTSSVVPALELLENPGAEWCMLVQIHPSRIHVRRERGWGYVETIELEGA